MSVTSGKAHARRTDPDTSHAAAKAVNRDYMRLSQTAVLKTLGRLRNGTDQDIARAYATSEWAEALPQSPSGLRTRRSELVVRGLVMDTGKRKTLASGRQAIVWAKTKVGA